MTNDIQYRKWALIVSLLALVTGLVGYAMGLSAEKGEYQEKVNVLESSQKIQDQRIDRLEVSLQDLKSDMSAIKTNVDWLRHHEETR